MNDLRILRNRQGAGWEALDASLRELKAAPAGRPQALVAHTIKGKGVSFMEGDNRWHYTRLNADTYAMAVAELAA